MIRAAPGKVIDEIDTSVDKDEMDTKILESLVITIEDSPITQENATRDALEFNKTTINPPSI